LNELKIRRSEKCLTAFKSVARFPKTYQRRMVTTLELPYTWKSDFVILSRTEKNYIVFLECPNPDPPVVSKNYL
jgi:hypothetical protein